MVAQDEQEGFRIEARSAIAVVAGFELEVWTDLRLMGAMRLEYIHPMNERRIVFG
jgi:hypothetical protein